MNDSFVQSPTVVLVNLVSPDFLERYQAPLAINTLAGYLNNKLPGTGIVKIDMQSIFKSKSIYSDVENSIEVTINEIVGNIISCCNERPTVVGLSIKWGTENIAKKIISKLSKYDNILFILGNCEVTFNYKRILNDVYFKNCVAVIGEGEEALVEIVKVASANLNNFLNLRLYSEIQNVAVKMEDNISIKSFSRVDLHNYPSLSILDPGEIYDEEYKYHAIETSRGCPWGSCTFCGIKNQFGIPSDDKKTDWRWKPFEVDTILKNIEAYALRGVQVFDIKDSDFFGPLRKYGNTDSFFMSMERVRKFSKGIIELNKKLPKKIKINHISCRVDAIFSEGETEKNKIRFEIFKMLKEVGVESIFLGIESGSPAQLKRYGKGVTVSENEKAIEILTALGFKVEPGFIMFDPFVTLKELNENIGFIERTKLYKYDSHILGSLRLQNGSPFVKLAESKGLLLNQIENSLTFDYNFMSDDVKIIESTFTKYESIARKLLRFLSVRLRLQGYENDFYLLKGLIASFGDEINWQKTLSEYLATTEKLLELAKYDIEKCVRGFDNLHLSLEYLEQSLRELNILKQIKKRTRVDSKILYSRTFSKTGLIPFVTTGTESILQNHYSKFSHYSSSQN